MISQADFLCRPFSFVGITCTSAKSMLTKTKKSLCAKKVTSRKPVSVKQSG